MSDQKHWENELLKALEIFRDLRLRSLRRNIDPRAVRAALKFIVMTDDYLSKQHGLTEEEDQKLTEIAKQLFQQVVKKKSVERFL